MHAEHGHLQEVILQNFVPHRRYYGEEPAEIADRGGRASYWRTGLGDAPHRDAARRGRRRSTIEDMKRLIGEARRLMPDVGIQVPPNLADWWPELVARGRDRPRRPERQRRPHLARAPVPVARTRCASASRSDGVALTERLCVYPQYIDPEWVAQGVLDVIKTQYWSFIPRRGSGRASAAPIRPRRRAGAIERARDGDALDAATS